MDLMNENTNKMIETTIKDVVKIIKMNDSR